MKKITAIALALLCAKVLFAQVIVGDPIICLNFDGLTDRSVSLDRTGKIVAIGYPTNPMFSRPFGRVKVFKEDAGEWVQIGNSIESTRGVLGYDISISKNGTRIAVPVSISGDFNEVRIYQNINNQFVLLDSIVSTTTDFFYGHHLALNADGTRIVFSSNSETFVYTENSSGRFEQLGQAISGFSGVSINDDGSRIACRIADGDQENRGKVAVFELISEQWQIIGSPIVGEEAGDASGRSIELNSSGNRIVITSNTSLNVSDNTRVFEETNGQWEMIGQVIYSDDRNYDFTSVSINDSGNTIGISYSGLVEDGLVQIYQLINNTWSQDGNGIQAENGETFFGSTVSLNGNGKRFATCGIVIVGGIPFNEKGQVVVYEKMTLPVTLFGFNGRGDRKATVLEWQTSSELNNYGFEVQKSKNGRDWQMIDFVEGKETTSEIVNYQSRDETPFEGANYYRLKQIELDGNFEYSEVISIEYNNIDGRIKLFPNPSHGLLNLQINNPSSNSIKISISDNLGRSVWKKNLITGTSDLIEKIEFRGEGIYILMVQVGEEVYYKRLIIKIKE